MDHQTYLINLLTDETKRLQAAVQKREKLWQDGLIGNNETAKKELTQWQTDIKRVLSRYALLE